MIAGRVACTSDGGDRRSDQAVKTLPVSRAEGATTLLWPRLGVGRYGLASTAGVRSGFFDGFRGEIALGGARPSGRRISPAHRPGTRWSRHQPICRRRRHTSRKLMRSWPIHAKMRRTMYASASTLAFLGRVDEARAGSHLRRCPLPQRCRDRQPRLSATTRARL
jgi:hypothetical protein